MLRKPFFVFLMLLGGIAKAQEQAQEADLTRLNIEELMNVEVSSVSRKEEKRVDAPAAVTVITREDIKRMGATSIPEALRLVPGLHVARASSDRWVVSSRGFSTLTSAKLLVLIDGRSVYSPLFSGVFWDVQDTLLEDVDRIEVIRGPGAVVWGANAMNGVVNVITRNAGDTQGTFVEAGGGTEERVFGGVRHGGALGANGHYRVYGKFFDRDSGFLPPGSPDSDDWRMGRTGLRTDWALNAADRLTFQGDAYIGRLGQLIPLINVSRPGPPSPREVKVAGGYAMAAWKRTLGSGSDLQLRLYYDRTHRNDPSLIDNLHTYDVDFQHRMPLPWQQDLIWGAAYRLMINDSVGTLFRFLDPAHAVDRIFSGFVQDEITLHPAFRLTLGSKFEHNSFSGFELQPGARFAWNLVEGHTLWGAVSRAVRVPTRIERDVSIDITDPATTPPPQPRLVGNKALEPEKQTAYELGYRMPLAGSVLLEASTFFNRYTDLMTFEAGTPFTDTAGTLVFPVSSQNQMVGNARGAELAASFEPERDNSWRLSASYTYFLLQLRPQASDFGGAMALTGSTPMHQAGARGAVALSDRLELSSFLRYVGSLSSTLTTSGAGVPDYATLDLRLAWRVTDTAEASIVGQNLLQSRHLEFPDGSEVERGVYAKVALRL